MESERNRQARTLFNGIAERYDLLAELLSFWQNRRWRRFLVSRLEVMPGQRVLDLCTGTAGVAIQIAKRYDAQVIGVDLSQSMLRQGHRNVQQQKVGHLVTLVQGRAEKLNYPDGYFDAVAFTYLLRYVEDAAATVAEVVRVLKPGGRLVSLDFAVPSLAIARGPWLLYTRAVLPLVTRAISPGWAEVGRFLGPSIANFYAGTSIQRLHQIWTGSGIGNVRSRRMSLGGGLVMWGDRGGEWPARKPGGHP